MNYKNLNIGILHSLIGKNDGVSIVIDQTVMAMIKYLEIDLGNIYFLAAHSSPRFNAETNEVFWHKNKVHKKIIEYYSQTPPPGFDEMIHKNSLYAKKIITEFIDKNNIDLLIAHNTSHPLNFLTAIGIGYYLEEQRSKGSIWPKVLVWWHDSYFERERFLNPNPVILKYLKYLPGTDIDGIIFINKTQPQFAKEFFTKYQRNNTELFFENRIAIIPNTSDITWKWSNLDYGSNSLIAPEQDNYNMTFFDDLGIKKEIESRNYTINDSVFLLQHSRIVPRKKIETAIDFAFLLEKKFAMMHQAKCICLLVSGHSGDEQADYKNMLIRYFNTKSIENKASNILLIFGEDHILSHREIIVDKKYFKFSEIPSIIASGGGIGVYFSEVEGFGNNLLEMISYGMPVIINKYEVYKTDVEPYGFDLPSVENCTLTQDIIDTSYNLLTDMRYRNKIIKHNLKILDEKLNHKLIADKLIPVIRHIFRNII